MISEKIILHIETLVNGVLEQAEYNAHVEFVYMPSDTSEDEYKILGLYLERGGCRFPAGTLIQPLHDTIIYKLKNLVNEVTL